MGSNLTPRPAGPPNEPAFCIGDEWVAIDLETTGLDSDQDRIIELGAVRFSAGRPVARFATLVNPQIELPPRIVALTGVTDSQLAAAPVLGDVLPEFLAFVGRLPVVGHNLSFDLAFLKRAMHGIDVISAPETSPAAWPSLAIDTLELARILMPRRPSHALAVLAQEDEQGPAGARHRAMNDAVAAGLLACELWQIALTVPARVVGAAIYWLEPARLQFAGLLAFLVGVRKERTATADAKGEAPLRGTRPGQATQGSPGLAIGRGMLMTELAEAFGPSGFMAASIPEYEVRDEQQAMCEAVAEVMSTAGRLAVEAGTGVGKSIAYLLPAVAVAEARSEKVVISTHTVTLQDQLVEREIPLLERALGRPVRHAVLKGRANYLCRRKWNDFLAGSLVADETERLFGLRVLFWLASTRTGDGAELNMLSQEGAIWRGLSGDERCWGPVCPHQRECLISLARSAAGDADIVIANHALVCSDVLADGRLLPHFEHLIVDEAHHFDAVATAHFGLVIDEAEIASLIAGVIPSRAGPARLLASASRGTGASGSNGLGAWPQPGDVADAARLGLMAQASTRNLFGELTRFAATYRRGSDNGTVYEIRYGTGGEPLAQACQAAARDAGEALRQLAAKLALIAERAPSETNASIDLAAAAKDCALRSAEIERLCRADDPDWVYWMASGNHGVRLSGAPITVADRLAQDLWARLTSIVLVSATLAVAGDFTHVLTQVGLTGTAVPSPQTLLLNSPFDFRSQVLLCVPRDLPLPGATETESGYAGAIAGFLAELLPAVGGRALVLFTSHRMLRHVYDLVAPELLLRGLNLLAQGVDGGRSRLLRALRHEDRSVVFGTSTFWEGIDVKGPQLSCLVIARLPFPRPDEPIVAARTERLEADGRSAFAELSLPSAILRLKQGFGRLIRSGEDHGAVVILDGRILRRRYGRLFVDSLPPASFYQGSSRGVISKVVDWLESGSRPGGVTWVEKHD